MVKLLMMICSFKILYSQAHIDSLLGFRTGSDPGLTGFGQDRVTGSSLEDRLTGLARPGNLAAILEPRSAAASPKTSWSGHLRYPEEFRGFSW